MDFAAIHSMFAIAIPEQALTNNLDESRLFNRGPSLSEAFSKNKNTDVNLPWGSFGTFI